MSACERCLTVDAGESWANFLSDLVAEEYVGGWPDGEIGPLHCAGCATATELVKIVALAGTVILCLARLFDPDDPHAADDALAVIDARLEELVALGGVRS